MANFSDEKIQKVWEKATIVSGQNPNEWRKDVCGAWINRGQYGQESKYGWEIDHVYPESKGGNHDIENLRPMYWENNRSKGNNYPTYKAIVKSEGNQNIRFESEFTVNDDLRKVLKQKFDLKDATEIFNEIHGY